MSDIKTPFKIEVETVYRVRIDYWFDEDSYPYPHADKLSRTEQVDAYAFMLGRELQYVDTVDVANNTGGPCWNGYLVLEGASRELVEQFAKSLVSYIKRFKGYHIE